MKNTHIILLVIFFLINGAFSLFAQTHSDQYWINKANIIHSKFFTIDTHNDTAIHINKPDAKTSVKKGQVSFAMMKEGGLDAAFFAIYVAQGPRDSLSLISAQEYVKDNIIKLKSYIDSKQFEASEAKTIEQLFLNKRNKTSSVVITIENGYAIGKDIAMIKKFRDMGVRAITICHNKNNDICDASMDTIVEHNGLSVFGKEVIREMNKIGVIIDVSHASPKTLFDVLNISSRPVMASHSGVYAIKNHKRNLTDKEIVAIANKGGLIQVASGGFFLSEDPKEMVTVKNLADHIDYVKKLVGIKHVGIGTDYDGGGGVVGMEKVDKMKNLTVELLKRGYSKRELKLFWGENVIRFLKAHDWEK